MKKLYILLFTILISSLSFGQVIKADGFDYPDGSLVPNGGWATHSGTAGDMQVVSGQVLVQHGTPSEDANLAFTPVSGIVYFAFDFSVINPGTPISGTDNEYFAHFMSGSTTFFSKVDIVPPTGAGDFSVGIASTASVADAVWATDLTYGTTYRLIVGYDQDANIAQLWINPSNSADTSISGADGTDSQYAAAAFGLRQSDSDLNEGILVDNLMIGGTFNDVLVFSPPTDPTLYLVDGPANGSTIEVGPEDLAGDLEFGTTNFVVDTPSAGDGYIKWSIINVTDGGTIHASGDIFDTSQIYPFAALEPFKTYTLNAELVDNSGASLSSPVVYTITANTLGYNSVSDLSGVRAGTEGLYYEVTGEVIISYIVTENSRNQKYIQDTSGGILIDDNNGAISTSFNIGDGLTGLKGQLSSFSGVLQLVPTVNVASASSTGVTITPEEVSAADLFNNGENYESELIKVSNVTFTPSGGTFSDNTSYDIVDGTTTTTCRVSFGDEDLIGTTIPNGSVAITGLGGDFNGTYQILPRYLSDIEATLSSESFNLNSFKVFPNPTALGYVTISSKNSANMSVAVFDILGKQVLDETLSNNTLNVSNLKSGVYIMKVSQDEASVTKKLVIQ